MLRLQPWCHFTHTYTVCKLPLIQQVSLGTKNVTFYFSDACQDFLSFASDFSFQHFNAGKL